jgi:MerR family transcriptional regulator, redox-sensitive transcriptional activator SoxR
MKVMDKLTIGEVAEATGVPTSTLRYYEKLGIIPPPQRSSGQRRYHPEVLQIMAVIQLGKDVGFSLPEIKELLYGFPEDMKPSEQWKRLAQRKIAEIDEIIASAVDMKRLLESGIECEYLHLELDSSDVLRRPRQ